MTTYLTQQNNPQDFCYQNKPCSSTKSFPSRTIVHAKLEMTEPGDHDEREADAVANTIAVGGKISRKISGGSGSSGITVSSQMESQLNHLKGGGQAMPTGLRNMMERGFGQDFSHVRLHTDKDAATLSSSIHAKAFTHGNDIYFNEGQYSPNTSEGQKLMAHELTHVVQGGGKIGRKDSFNPKLMGLAGGGYLNLFDIGDYRLGLWAGSFDKLGAGLILPDKDSLILSYNYTDSEIALRYDIPKFLSTTISMRLQEELQYGGQFTITPHLRMLDSLSTSIKATNSAIKELNFSYSPFNFIEAKYNYKTNEHRITIMFDIGKLIEPNKKK